MSSCAYQTCQSRDHFNQSCLTKGKIATTFASWGKIDTTKYFGSCATKWTVSDLDWISETIILKFRLRIGYGVYENISDPIRLAIAKFPYPYTSGARETSISCCQGCNGAGTHGNGVPTPFSCFASKWVWSCFKTSNFLGAFPHVSC